VFFQNARNGPKKIANGGPSISGLWANGMQLAMKKQLKENMKL